MNTRKRCKYSLTRFVHFTPDFSFSSSSFELNKTNPNIIMEPFPTCSFSYFLFQKTNSTVSMKCLETWLFWPPPPKKNDTVLVFHSPITMFSGTGETHHVRWHGANNITHLGRRQWNSMKYIIYCNVRRWKCWSSTTLIWNLIRGKPACIRWLTSLSVASIPVHRSCGVPTALACYNLCLLRIHIFLV